jgi:hypothetical protein
MRMMLKVQVPVEAGNAAVASGGLPELLQTAMQQLQPEAAYFVTEDGLRTSYSSLTSRSLRRSWLSPNRCSSR